jgi:hypothetical protein
MCSSGVRYPWYLLTRGWFIHSKSLQDLMVEVLISGKGHQINVAAGDFDEHLEELLSQ